MDKRADQKCNSWMKKHFDDPYVKKNPNKMRYRLGPV